MPRTRAGWKMYERRRAKEIEALRIPITGRQGPRGDPGDIEIPGFYVEVRDRAEPRPIRWFEEVVAAAAAFGTMPLLIFKGRAPYRGALALMRWSDLRKVMADARRAQGTGPAAQREGAAPDPDSGERSE